MRTIIEHHFFVRHTEPPVAVKLVLCREDLDVTATNWCVLTTLDSRNGLLTNHSHDEICYFFNLKVPPQLLSLKVSTLQRRYCSNLRHLPLA